MKRTNKLPLSHSIQLQFGNGISSLRCVLVILTLPGPDQGRGEKAAINY